MRIMLYFQQQRFLGDSTADQNLIVELSPSLQQTVTVQIHNFWAKKSWIYFCKPPSLVFLCQRLKTVLHCPTELTSSAQVFCIVLKGVGFHDGHLLIRGETWGQDFIIDNP